MIAGSFEYVIKIQPMRGEGQDRAAVFERNDGGITIALADGAGGTSNGDLAAQAVLDTVQVLAGSDADWSVILQTLDRDTARLRGGQTTAIVVVLDEAKIRGASVGDSEAWLVYRDRRIEAITGNQERKPLLGSGAHVMPTSEAALGEATLLVASDGLFRTAKPMDIARIAAGPDLAAAADNLVDLVRTDIGAVLDDVSIVLVRRLVV
ncbi:MAG TPA: SpoIIE family protein phosphatase [Kofleriaceae bacterium]|nr:SpoIIE family protein phosphatase [Kofleriaceae bacterium]